MDQRIKVLAHQLVTYSCQAQPGENVYIHYIGEATEALATALVDEVYAAGATPYVQYTSPKVQRKWLMNCSSQQLQIMADQDASLMEKMHCYIGVRGTDNVSELSDVPADKMALYDTIYMEKVHHHIRVPKTKWVVLRYPNDAMAQLSGQSTESFEDFYYEVCCLDYAKMKKAMDPLIALMNQTDRVRIVAPGTDLSFSIQGIPAVPCSGDRNIPDGEVYTAPVRDSVEGIITYNAPSLYQGVTYEQVSFTFSKGKIVEARANHTDKINQLLDTDEGARYIGEFAIGVNPYILKPMKDILFDEKISGSIHFTPGRCYKEAYNGNESAIHWDLVLIQRPEYGGGEIYFDDVLIRKDGRFVLPDLQALNPENLMR